MHSCMHACMNAHPYESISCVYYGPQALLCLAPKQRGDDTVGIIPLSCVTYFTSCEGFSNSGAAFEVEDFAWLFRASGSLGLGV